MAIREDLDVPGQPSICVIRLREGGHYCSMCPVMMKPVKPQRAVVHIAPDPDDPGLNCHLGPMLPMPIEPPKGPWTPFLEQVLYCARRNEPLPQELLDSLRDRCPRAYEMLDIAVSRARSLPSSRAAYQVVDLMPALIRPNGLAHTTVLGGMRVTVPLDESGLLYFIGEQTP